MSFGQSDDAPEAQQRLADETGGRHRIVAHRGLWRDASERNSLLALTSAIDQGFGIETDLRDVCDSVAVRHDPFGQHLKFSELAPHLARCEGPIALNVKSDGLAALIQGRLALPDSTFFFDMSWPQTLAFVRAGLPVALRTSEWEPLDLGLFSRLGIPVRVVLDGFQHDWWFADKAVREACVAGEVMMISPEIHDRDPGRAWNWAAERVAEGGAVTVCTDRCAEAMEAMQ